MEIPKHLASVLAGLTGIQKSVTDQFKETMLELSQKRARSFVFKALDKQIRLDNPGEPRGYSSPGDQVHLRHENIDLILTRYIRGDIISAYLDGISVAVWVDQSVAYSGLIGENDIKQRSAFSMEMIQAIRDHSDIASLFVKKDVSDTLYTKTDEIGMIGFKDQFGKVVPHRSISLALFPDLKRGLLEEDFGL